MNNYRDIQYHKPPRDVRILEKTGFAVERFKKNLKRIGLGGNRTRDLILVQMLRRTNHTTRTRAHITVQCRLNSYSSECENTMGQSA